MLPSREHLTSCLMLKEKEINKLNEFRIFTDRTAYDSETLPTQATYTTYNNYILATSSIKEKKLILLKYARKQIRVNRTIYFPIRLPNDRELKSILLDALTSAEIKITKELTISWDSTVTTQITRNKNLPKKWVDRLPMLQQDLQQQTATIYKQPKTPTFPLYIAQPKEDKKTVENFLNYSTDNPTPYQFYAKALLYHVAYATGIFNQYTVNQVIANPQEIRKLLPNDLTLDRLLTLAHPSKSTHTIKKENDRLIFTYDIEKLNTLSGYTDDNGNRQKYQNILIPFKLLPEIFKSCSFGKNGLPYFLIIIYGYHARYSKVNYKLSTIIRYANINTSRGHNYTLEAIEKPLRYLKKIGVIGQYDKPTLEHLKQDKAITIYLNSMKYWGKII